MQKNFVVIMSAAFALLSLVTACANSDDNEPPIPTVTQQTVTPEAPEPEDDQGVFLRVIAPLDEDRGYCLDIPGQLSGVRLDSPMQAHTCKQGAWNLDGRFDEAVLANGVIRMPEYNLCIQADNASVGGSLRLTECADTETRIWNLQESGEIALAANPQLCVTIDEGPGVNAGGPQYLRRSVGLETCAVQVSDRQRWMTATPE
jgi:hypothetical protein